jgi:exodeoxyribonuclease VII large subunit
VRELRASARRATDEARRQGVTQRLGLRRSAQRAQGAQTAARRRELERLSLALGAHDRTRTLQRGYALITDHAGAPLSAAAQAAVVPGPLTLHFHDGALRARVQEGET